MNNRNFVKLGVLLLMSIIICNCGSNQRTHLTKEPPYKLYKGNVKKIITYSCQSYIPNGENIKILAHGCNIEKIEEFDEKETLLTEIKFDNPRERTAQTNIITTVRDDKGNIIEKTDISNYFFKLKVRHEYKYNDLGFLIEEIQYNDDKFYTRSTYSYDKYNCQTEENYFNNKNQLEYKYISIFNNSNLMTKRTGYTPDGEISSYMINDYDKEGKLIKRRDYDWQNKLTDETDYKDKPTDKRDANNNLIEFLDYDNITHLKKIDRFNRCTEEQLHKDRTWLETRTWAYRDDGALIEESFSTSKFAGEAFHKVTTKYKIDNVGNWIEKYSIDNEDKSVVGLGARNIEYYTN